MLSKNSGMYWFLRLSSVLITRVPRTTIDGCYDRLAPTIGVRLFVSEALHLSRLSQNQALRKMKVQPDAHTVACGRYLVGL